MEQNEKKKECATEQNKKKSRKKEKMEKVYRAYEAKNFNACINLIRSIGGDDSELNYIYAYCQLELGKQNVAKGALITALKNLKTAAEYCEKTTWLVSSTAGNHG